jgi:type I site-specific restriction endonuclease
VSRVFWLGVIGLFFGIIGAVLAIAIQSLGEAFNATSGSNLYVNAAGAFIFSIVGMTGAVLEGRRILGGLLMIIGSLGVLISISLFGVISFFFFVIGGILILVRKREEPVVTPPTSPITGQNEGGQVEAITNLERSFGGARPRALIQMATGTGKTFTAVSFAYRLIKFANAKRILFLVDRSNRGRQTFREFQQYVTPDDGRKFTELYNVQRLTSNTLDPVNRVCITTIQRLYSMLSGEPEPDEVSEEASAWERPVEKPQKEVEITYNPAIPMETFDFIITDECHRSIYNLWRQVLEYFDAFLIGLTATPSKQTLGFFDQNLVMEYSHERAVADGVNVGYELYRIKTKITESGSVVEAGNIIDKRDRLTRKQRWEQLEEDLTFSADDLDREVVAVDQIRTIIRTFKERLFTEIFPGRREVPKTLIFAKNDLHAEDIVGIARAEFENLSLLRLLRLSP